MSLLTEEVLIDAMKRSSNIRNLSIIAHVDHGKSTLTDSLACKAGLIPEFQVGQKLFTDNREDEKERGITIKSTAVSMYFNMNSEILGDLKRDGDGFLVNLIDSPGHVDFSSEVTAALRVTDGAVVIVDCVSGCSAQTETVLRQALNERIKPVLMINKIDRAILEQQLGPEELFLKLSSIIEQVNFLINVYSNKNEDDSCIFDRLDPIKGNVAFGAGKYGWGFTLRAFAQMYQKKYSNSASFVRKLWGDNYFNNETKKWQTQSDSNSQRGFNKFILEPLYKALKVCLDLDYSGLDEIITKLDLKVRIKPEDKDKFSGKDLMSYFMKKWLPAADAMLELIVLHLPSPLEAQKYRVKELYEGPMDDEAAQAIRECNAHGHLMIYISKMIPAADDKRKFYALGRVFSGAVSTGMRVRILGPNYQLGSDNDLYVGALSKCMVMIGNEPISVDQVPCGNIVALTGVEKFLLKSGTITTYEQAHTIRNMKFMVSAIVKVAVEPANPIDLPKLIEGLRRLAKSDPLVKIESDKGQHVIAGAGELHLEICLRDLEHDHARIPLKIGEPLVTYKETVTIKSNQICLAKSGNKHNRVFMTAEPLTEEFCADIESEKITLNQEKKQMLKYLNEKHGFDVSDAKKIWCFGPNQFGSNVLIDCTKGVQSSTDVRETLCAGFQWGSDEGVLCGEQLRGVRFNLEDLVYHSDPAHRKGGQLIPTMRRAMMSSMLTAKPRLYEPIYLAEIQCPSDCIGAVYSILNKKRGEIIEEQMISGTSQHSIKGYLPVNESTGFCGDIRSATKGKASPTCTFHHWQLLPGDPLDVNTKSGQICREIRLRKNMSENLPTLDSFLDKL